MRLLCDSNGYLAVSGDDLGVAVGVWRRKTIVAVGGWKSRTTVEDMDLSLRTYVNGWKAIYLNDVVCVNEVHHCPRIKAGDSENYPIPLKRKGAEVQWL